MGWGRRARGRRAVWAGAWAAGAVSGVGEGSLLERLGPKCNAGVLQRCNGTG